MIVTVFRSRLADGVQDEYGPMARMMGEAARTIPGYVSHKVFVADDGERATIVEFETEEALQAWKMHEGHLEAKRLGITRFFTEFKYQICHVAHARSWQRKARGDHG